MNIILCHFIRDHLEILLIANDQGNETKFHKQVHMRIYGIVIIIMEMIYYGR